ncbi:MAG: HAD-IIIC family phosphatase [Spirochaetes bacterium]|nr:HAD-IIIC family phosphatase [Spirochaetota bacterium]
MAKDNIVVTSMFHFEPLLDGLNFWKNKLNYSLDFTLAQYNQVFQELLNPASLLRSNEKGMNVLLIRFEDWFHYYENKEQHEKTIKTNTESRADIDYLNKTFQYFMESLKTYLTESNCYTYIIICPTSHIYHYNLTWCNLFSQMEEQLLNLTKENDSIDGIRSSEFHHIYQTKNIFEPVKNQLGHIPFTNEFFYFLGTLIIRRYFSLNSHPYKVFVLDCDNTLWEGICGEQKPNELKITKRFTKFQKFLLDQKNQGKLLTLCSKNIEKDVQRVFDQNPSMLLKEKDIVDSKINWQPKSENILELADCLNLNPDSFIFFDDNPVECAEVKTKCPEVFTINFSAEEEKLEQILNHYWIFDASSPTKEDANRTALYQANINREKEQKQSNSFEDFLNNLNLQINIKPMTENEMSRVSQLTKRTNQFNFTTIRRNINDIKKLSSTNDHCLTVHVSDRFGVYGLVGVIIYKKEETVLKIDTFLLSCRVLGRGVEHKMISELSKIAAQDHLAEILVPYVKTEKNQSAQIFLETIGAKYQTIDHQDVYYHLPAKKFKNLKFQSPKSKANQKSGNKKNIKKDQQKNIKPARESFFAEISSLNTSEKISYAVEQYIQQNAPEFSVKKEVKKSQSIETKQAQPLLLEKLLNLFSRFLNISIDQLDIQQDLEYYQLDSYKVLEISVELNKMFADIPITFLYEYTTIEAIYQKLKGKECKIINELDHSQDVYTQTDSNDIAIIGMSGKYPGAENMTQLWSILEQGICTIGEAPTDRWDFYPYFAEGDKKNNKTYNKMGGFLKDIDQFEAGFFNISPHEAMMMDPQQRLFLQITWQLLEDAGYTPDTISRNTSVFVGAVNSDYRFLTNNAVDHMSIFPFADLYQIANRVSYFFNLKGPSLTIDSACSSSAGAMYFACQNIISRESETAIVGGVNILINPVKYVQFSQMEFLAKNNQCSPFGENASGMILGEGIGAVLIKKLDHAIKDNDHIYGVIKGIAMNSGGKVNGFTVPDPNAQASVITAAIEKAKISSNTISYIEAHGTGTKIGDPIEIRGLTKAFQETSAGSIQNQYCSLGSIKSNIGHSEGCAFIAGLTKLLLQIKHQKLIASLNSSPANSFINFSQTPFIVQQNLSQWTMLLR